MSTKHFILGLASVAALAIPYAASAQPDYRQPDYGGQPNYGQPQGDYDRGYDRGEDHGRDWDRRFPGYPEFRDREGRLRELIWRSVREDMIAPDDARELMEQLRRIQWHEQHAFQEHGWNLPDDDRQRIHFELEQLDHQIDQMRQER
jgi:hypothetical protein